jgi:cation diffusion facilitator family transporter
LGVATDARAGSTGTRAGVALRGPRARRRRPPPAPASSTKVLYAALAGNLCIAVTKFVAAAWTGSSAMLSEGVHSIADTGNEVLLLYGMRRAAKPPDDAHPLGHGREIYFWSFIVALMIFALGAGAALYEGVTHLLDPVAARDPLVIYVVLGVSAVFEGASWLVALREFRREKGAFGYLEAMQRSKDPPGFMVLFEDTAALLGLAIVAVGTIAASATGQPAFDGIASIAIGLLLAATAALLAIESKGLLIGERAHDTLCRSLRRIAEGSPAIRQVDDVFTVHLAPDQIVGALRVQLAPDLRAADVERAIAALVDEARTAHPEVVRLFVTPLPADAAE